MQVFSWTSVNTTLCPQALTMVFQGGGVYVRYQTQPDPCNYKNQSQQQKKSAPNEVLSMLSKYCIWLTGKWCFVPDVQPEGWDVGTVLSRPSMGITAVDETPPPSAGCTENGAGLMFVYWWNCKIPLKKKVVKNAGAKVLTSLFSSHQEFFYLWT